MHFPRATLYFFYHRNPEKYAKTPRGLTKMKTSIFGHFFRGENAHFSSFGFFHTSSGFYSFSTVSAVSKSSLSTAENLSFLKIAFAYRFLQGFHANRNRVPISLKNPRKNISFPESRETFVFKCFRVIPSKSLKFPLGNLPFQPNVFRENSRKPLEVSKKTKSLRQTCFSHYKITVFRPSSHCSTL